MPGRGAVVNKLTHKDIRDMLDVLVSLETLAESLARRYATDEQIAGLRRTHDEMMAFYAAGIASSTTVLLAQPGDSRRPCAAFGKDRGRIVRVEQVDHGVEAAPGTVAHHVGDEVNQRRAGSPRIPA